MTNTLFYQRLFCSAAVLGVVGVLRRIPVPHKGSATSFAALMR
jgi:hypothetical protein